MSMKEPYQVFKAFADETRLRILSLLSHGEMCVSDIDAVLGVGQSRVSRHLDYLKKTALVDSQRRGQLIVYRLDVEHHSEAQGILEIWKQWGQTTQTGQADWQKYRQLVQRIPRE